MTAVINLMRWNPAKNKTDCLIGANWCEKEEKPTEIIEDWCKRSGSSMRGRIDSFRYLTKYKIKIPVMISEDTKVFYFPTSSSTREDCWWICYNNILHYKNVRPGTTIIQFIDGHTEEIEVDYRTIKREINMIRNYRDILHQKENTGLPFLPNAEIFKKRSAITDLLNSVEMEDE